jgi:hypothetical protein
MTVAFSHRHETSKFTEMAVAQFPFLELLAHDQPPEDEEEFPD